MTLSNRYVLDSYAILALLQGEPGAATVHELIRRAIANDAALLMSEINLGEVLYHIERRHGVDEAQATLVELEALPIQMADVSRQRILTAAHLKANYRIAYADAFAAGLALEHGASLVSGDPEFRAMGELLPIEWIGHSDG